ncbi:TVP38/TMEM64 family protein [Halomicrobium sp. LC1Hm]|uniref:TVP38/TMEM64 family protein n=1 Tax=Halomicrobium sp. LC1Hm TaxID=2610902 RepID=UPI00129824D5|nr:hypothetical protein LC1Hm_0850 [Halomicrobium sp. LC1Hm]
MTGKQSSVTSSAIWGAMLLSLVFLGTWIALQDVSAWDLWGSVSSTTKSTPLLVMAIFVLYLIRPVTGFPSAVLSFLVGAKFGIIQGLPIVVLGSVITGLPAYYLGTYSRQLPAWIPGVGRFQTVSESLLDRVGVYRGMFAASLSPTPLDPVAWAAGMADVRLPIYLLATLMAAVPWAGAYCYSGAVAGGIATTPGRPPLGVIIFGGVISGLLLFRPAIEWIRDRQIPTESAYNE